MEHEKWLRHAVEMAIENVRNGCGPFAAVVVKDGKAVGSGTNLAESLCDPTGHAELLAIREACSVLQTADLSDCVLYASGEPCPMCLGAAYWTSVKCIYYACSKKDANEDAGFADPLEDFFADQQLPPEKRRIPFIQQKTGDEAKPFYLWKKQQKNS